MMGEHGDGMRLRSALKEALRTGQWDEAKRLGGAVSALDKVHIAPPPKKKKNRAPAPAVTTFRCPMCKNPRGTPHVRSCRKGKTNP